MHKESRFYALDGIRGFAALAVAVYHYSAINGLAVFPGFLAVDLFFVLSGFVIALSYADKLERGLGVSGFMTLRLERLYPLWLLGGLIALVHFLAMGLATTAPKWLAGITVANLLMLPASAEHSTFPLNMPGWSLFFELLVNFAFALWLWRLRNIVLTAIMLGAGVLLVAMATAPHYFNMGSEWPTFLGGVPRTLYSFLAGVMIFRLGAAVGRRATWLSLVPVVLALLTICWTPPAEMLVEAQRLSVLLLFPLLVWLAVRWELPPGLEKAAQRLGDISYPLYVLHVPLLFLGDAAREWTGSAEEGLPIYLTSVALFAWLMAVVDRAVRARLKRLRLARAARPLRAAV